MCMRIYISDDLGLHIKMAVTTYIKSSMLLKLMIVSFYLPLGNQLSY